MTKRPSLLLGGALAGTAVLLACGSLGDANQGSPLATIHGSLSGDPTPPEDPGLSVQAGAAAKGPIRIVVVWRNAQSAGFNASADVPVTTGTKPFEFSLSLAGAPPVDVLITRSIIASEAASRGSSSDDMANESPGVQYRKSLHIAGRPLDENDLSADFAYAMGTLIAYRDNNGNGTLDLVDSGAMSFLDEVIGINEDLGIFWFQGTIPNGRELRARGRSPQHRIQLGRFSDVPRYPVVV